MQTFVTKLGLPVTVSLELDFCSITYRHMVGISLYMSSETRQVEYHIIDGTYHAIKAIYFNQENIDWCCGNELSFNKISYVVVFVLRRTQVFEMFHDESGYNLVAGIAVCLRNSSKIG